ncbi:MAG: hypothetical protein GY710_01285 [Desulfobacteraceae bacterium]|nr:hypothetical protein [Desulfobacteraceae bacterium]
MRIIENKTNGLTAGCQILIDGVQIGGDKSIQYPDPNKANKQIKKGFLRYFLTVGLLRFGLPFGVIATIFNSPNSIIPIGWLFLMYALPFGLAMSFFSWRNIKKIARNKERSLK